MPTKREKQKYFLRNLLKGLLWFTIIVGMFILGKKNISPDKLEHFAPFFDNTGLIYTIYYLSELFFGLLPPELFMFWALSKEDAALYIQIISLLFVLSYSAGIIGYFFGRFLDSTIFFRWLRLRFLGKYLDRFQEFGDWLIIVAATTPLPFSAICMVAGASRFPYKKFFLLSLTRIFRFLVYAWIIWEMGIYTA